MWCKNFALFLKTTIDMFGGSSFGTSSFGNNTTGGISLGLGNQPNPMKDLEVTNPPDDSISCLRFSPPSVNTTSFLIAGSWDNNVRCWEILGTGQSVPKTQQSMQVTPFQTFVTDRLVSFILYRVQFWTFVGTTMAPRCLWLLATSKSSVGI